MTDLSLTILPETNEDALAIERLHERTFGPGRYARTAFRLREGHAHLVELSFTAWVGTLLVGSVQMSPIRIGDTKALLLGPLTVEPPFRSRGIGLALLKRALAHAKERGHRLVLLVGDEPYYARAGFKRKPRGRRCCLARSIPPEYWSRNWTRARFPARRARSCRNGRLDVCASLPVYAFTGSVARGLGRGRGGRKDPVRLASL
jgi:predicted N-acetyltransferase YhbS